MLSVDPLYVGAVADPQRWNRYGYALNSPVVMVDPDGRTTTCSGPSTIPGSELGSCSSGGGTGYHRGGAPSVNTPSPGQPPLLGGGGLGSMTDPDRYFDLTYGVGYRPSGGIDMSHLSNWQPPVQQAPIGGVTSATTSPLPPPPPPPPPPAPKSDPKIGPAPRFPLSLHPGMVPIHVTREELDEVHALQKQLLALCPLGAKSVYGWSKGMLRWGTYKDVARIAIGGKGSFVHGHITTSGVHLRVGKYTVLGKTYQGSLVLHAPRTV